MNRNKRIFIFTTLISFFIPIIFAVGSMDYSGDIDWELVLLQSTVLSIAAVGFLIGINWISAANSAGSDVNSQTSNKLDSKLLFEQCIENAKQINLLLAKLDGPIPELGAIFNKMQKELDGRNRIWCVRHSFTLLVYALLKENKSYLGSKLDSELGTSIMTNLIKIDQSSINPEENGANSREKAVARQSKNMREAVALAMHMEKGNSIDGLSPTQAVVKIFCSGVFKMEPEHLKEVEKLTRKQMKLNTELLRRYA